MYVVKTAGRCTQDQTKMTLNLHASMGRSPRPDIKLSEHFKISCERTQLFTSTSSISGPDLPAHLVPLYRGDYLIHLCLLVVLL